MDIQAKLDAIQEQQQSLLQQTPAQHRNKNLSKLYNDITTAKNEEKDAPFRVKEAEKRYYILRDGSNGYKDHMKKLYGNETRKIRQEMLNEFNMQMEELSKSISVYESMKTYLLNLSEVQLTLLTKIREMVKKILSSDADTNNRKTYYILDEQSYLNNWILSLNVFIFLFAMYYVSNHRTTSDIFITLLLLSSVFILPFLVSMIEKINPPELYTEMGLDPSTRTYLLIVPVFILVVWFMIESVYKNVMSDTMLLALLAPLFLVVVLFILYKISKV